MLKSKLINERTGPIGDFLTQIVRYPLLTRKEEIEYGIQVQQMMSLLNAKEALKSQLKRIPNLSEWADYLKVSPDELKKKLQQGQQAKHKLIVSNIKLVVSIAKHYQNRGLELPDLIQEGVIGMSQGVEKFDPNKGYKFSTYIYWWIKQGITRAIPQKGRTIRLPVHTFEKLNKIKKQQSELEQKLGRTPTVKEISLQTKFTPEEIRQLIAWRQNPMSLNLLIGEEEDTEVGEVLKTACYGTPEEYAESCCMSDTVKELIGKLSPQQQQVLRLRFGLDDGQKKTLAKIAECMRLSRERIRQIERDALEILKRQNSKDEISYWL